MIQSSESYWPSTGCTAFMTPTRIYPHTLSSPSKLALTSRPSASCTAV